nr:MAG TPA: hypothetical protein [Bacteriophage sp.]
MDYLGRPPGERAVIRALFVDAQRRKDGEI